jgi:hypothetical protein
MGIDCIMSDYGDFEFDTNSSTYREDYAFAMLYIEARNAGYKDVRTYVRAKEQKEKDGLQRFIDRFYDPLTFEPIPVLPETRPSVFPDFAKTLGKITLLVLLSFTIADSAYANYIDAAHHHTHRVAKEMAITDPSSPSAFMNHNYDKVGVRSVDENYFNYGKSTGGHDVLTITNELVPATGNATMLKMNSAYSQSTFNAPMPTDAPVAAQAFAVQATTLAPIVLTPPPAAAADPIPFDAVTVPAKSSVGILTLPAVVTDNDSYADAQLYAASTDAVVSPDPRRMLPQ